MLSSKLTGLVAAITALNRPSLPLPPAIKISSSGMRHSVGSPLMGSGSGAMSARISNERRPPFDWAPSGVSEPPFGYAKWKVPWELVVNKISRAPQCKFWILTARRLKSINGAEKRQLSVRLGGKYQIFQFISGPLGRGVTMAGAGGIWGRPIKSTIAAYIIGQWTKF